MSAFLWWKASFVIEIMETNVRVTCTVTVAKKWQLDCVAIAQKVTCEFAIQNVILTAKACVFMYMHQIL